MCVVLFCVVAAVYSENKKCQTCIELDVDNAKGSASVMGISMTFSAETMKLEAKVDDNGRIQEFVTLARRLITRTN